MTAYLIGRSSRRASKGAGAPGGFRGAKYGWVWEPPVTVTPPGAGPFPFGAVGYGLLDGVLWDEGGYADGASGFLIPTGLGGLYRVDISVAYDAGVPAGHMLVLDGSGSLDAYVGCANPGNGLLSSASALVYLREGSSITTVCVANQTTFAYFGIEYVCPLPGSSPLV